MGSNEPEVVHEEDDLIVMYLANSTRKVSALTIFSQNEAHNLVSALVAIRLILAKYAQVNAVVRYGQAQGGRPAHLIINYGGELDPETRSLHARAFVHAIKMLG